jgi:hypothetical protein
MLLVERSEADVCLNLTTRIRSAAASEGGPYRQVRASGFFGFGVKSLHPIGSVVHLKSVQDQRVLSCPLQERM